MFNTWEFFTPFIAAEYFFHTFISRPSQKKKVKIKIKERKNQLETIVIIRKFMNAREMKKKIKSQQREEGKNVWFNFEANDLDRIHFTFYHNKGIAFP